MTETGSGVLARHAFVTTVAVKDYKSIAACTVPLQSLTFLIGANGTGKSNFLDALRFVTESLRTSLDHAIRERGGVNEVRRRSFGRPRHFGIRVEFVLSADRVGHYAFSIADRPNGAFVVRSEECVIRDPSTNTRKAFYVIKDDVVASDETEPLPARLSDRLFLVNLSGSPTYRPVYDALSRMGFYNLNPREIADLQAPDPGDLLARDGHNLASVLARLLEFPATRERIQDYMARIIPGLSAVDVKAVGNKETLTFTQDVGERRVSFLASNMSDGTLRALAILVALFQAERRNGASIPLVGIEEPEVALHPAAVGVLLEALRSATRHTQVVVTSHSPDLLDTEDIETDEILAVEFVDGSTRIGQIDQVGRQALLDRLYTAGDLLRLNQLRPDVVRLGTLEQMRLFDWESD